METVTTMWKIKDYHNCYSFQSVVCTVHNHKYTHTSSSYRCTEAGFGLFGGFVHFLHIFLSYRQSVCFMVSFVCILLCIFSWLFCAWLSALLQLTAWKDLSLKRHHVSSRLLNSTHMLTQLPKPGSQQKCCQLQTLFTLTYKKFNRRMINLVRSERTAAFKKWNNIY